MSQFRQTVSVPIAFPATNAPNIDLPFEPSEWEIANPGATSVDISFEKGGTDAPIQLVLAAAAGPRKIPGRFRKMWCKDGAGTGSLVVEARTAA